MQKLCHAVIAAGFLLSYIFYLLTPAQAQSGTLAVQLTHQVSAPWDKACTATLQKNCAKGWRIYDQTDGVGMKLFDIPVPTTSPFAGTVTASGSGSFALAGTVGATTVGLGPDGKEIESLMTLASGTIPPGAPQIQITITVSAIGGQ